MSCIAVSRGQRAHGRIYAALPKHFSHPDWWFRRPKAGSTSNRGHPPPPGRRRGRLLGTIGLPTRLFEARRGERTESNMVTELVKPLYTAEATATGGRDGRVSSTRGALDVVLRPPVELGGPGGATNPEELFAAGYAACFQSALAVVARREKVSVDGSTVTGERHHRDHPGRVVRPGRAAGGAYP